MSKPRLFETKRTIVAAQQFFPASDNRPKGIVLDGMTPTWGGKYIREGEWAVTLTNGEKVICPQDLFWEIFEREGAE